MKTRLPAAAAAALLVLTGCTKSAPKSSDKVSQPGVEFNQTVDGDTTADDMVNQCRKGAPVSGRPVRVVTSAAPITSLVGQLAAGTGIIVEGVIPESSNSHTYELTAADTAKIAEADIIISNGLGMENGFAQAAEESAKVGALTCELGTAAVQKGDYLFDSTFTKEQEIPNPHAWMNPLTLLRYLDSARDALSSRAPSAIKKMDENYVKLSFQVLSLDAAMLKAVATIPVRNTTLYLFHDSLAYFATHFKMEIGLILQPPTFGDPVPVEVADAIAAMKSEGAVAFFAQSEFPGTYADDIAKSAGVTVATISDEDLPGSPGSAGHTIGESMKNTFVTVVETLGGDASAVKAVSTRLGLKDSAVYPG